MGILTQMFHESHNFSLDLIPEIDESVGDAYAAPSADRVTRGE